VTELATAVALADGRLADAERSVIEQQVMNRPGLSEDERRRLHALFTRVAAAPPSAASLRKHASLLPEDLRRDAGDLLVAVAHADGRLERSEVTRVNRYFDMLGLGRPGLGSQPGTSGTGDLTPVRTTGDPAPGYVIPRPPGTHDSSRRPGVALDAELIEAKLAETAKAEKLLAGIFTGDPTGTFTAVPDAAAPKNLPSPATADLPGPAFDAVHRQFLVRLAERPSWPRSEVSALAASLGLMPAGALEIVNDAALELDLGLVAEGTDPVYVDTDAAKEMLE
jgi:uncharacterized tellurite resistance protein B-like protein